MTLSMLNNNPGNLRPVGASTGFQSFASPQEGLAAMQRDLLLKIEGRSRAMKARFGEDYAPTLANLINTWAPPSENDTGLYLRNVARSTGIAPDQILRPEDTAALIPAITKQEGGAKAAQYFAQGDTTMNDASSDEGAILAELKRRGLDENGQPLTIANNNDADPEKEEIISELSRRGVNINDSILNSPAKKAQEEQGLTRTVFDQAMQGIPFSDEIMDAGGSVLASLVTGEKFKDVYADARKSSQARLAAQQDQRPGTSLLANLAGGIVGFGAGGGVLSKAAPKAAGALQTYAQTAPLKAAAGLGGTSGALYGAGAGTEGTRGESALQGGVVGAIGGPALAFLGRNAIAPLAERVANSGKSVLSKIGGESSSPPPTAIEKAFAPNLQKPNGELFSKTAGQRTQNTDAQRLENNARAGLVTQDAQRAIQGADIAQNREYHTFVDKLAGDKLDKNQDVNALVEGIGNSIQANATAKNKAVSSAYELAREGNGVKINIQDIRQGLWKSIADTRRENAYDLSQMPKATAVVKRLASYSRQGKASSITSAKLGELENWRKQATNARISTQDPTERKFLGEMVRKYDGFMEQTAAGAADVGDAEAIKAFRSAVKERREYGQLFEGNKLIEGIVEGNKSIDDTVKDLIGTGSIKGKKQMADNLDAILKASGDPAAAKADLRQAFTRRIYDKVANGTEADNPNMDRLSAAKLKTELENLFVHQSEFAKKLYGEPTQKSALKAIQELKLISTTQPNVKNPSGSGELVGRILNNLAKVPVVGKAAGPVNAAVSSTRRFQEEKAVHAGLSEFQDVMKNYKPRSTLWSVAGASTAPINKSEPKDKKDVR